MPITVCQPQQKINTPKAKDFDHTDYGVSHTLFEKITQEVWIELLEIFLRYQTPTNKNWFINEYKTQDALIERMQDFLRQKKSLAKYMSIREHEQCEDLERPLPQECDRGYEYLPSDSLGKIHPLKANDSKSNISYLKPPSKPYQDIKGAASQEAIDFGFFGKGPVFRVMSPMERSIYTYTGQKGEDLDKIRDDVIYADKATYRLMGPHLCMQDAKVLGVLLDMCKTSVFQNGEVKTSFSAIWKLLNKNSHSKIHEAMVAIRKSLSRLSKFTFSISPSIDQKDVFFSGNILSYHGYSHQGCVESIKINVNRCLIKYSAVTPFHDIEIDLLSMMTDWEIKLALYINSNTCGIQDQPHTYFLESLQEHLCPPSQFHIVNEATFQVKIAEAIYGLKDKGFLHSDSGVYNGTYVFIKSLRKSFVKHQFNRVPTLLKI